MATNNKLNLSELDFDQIKESLKEFLKANPTFTDYEFEGSALSTLLDLLAYNTHLNSYYANMLVNESFLDSAVKRASVVSKAKALGYTPKSYISPSAIVDIKVVPTGDPDNIALVRGTSFTGVATGQKFNFVVPDSYQTVKVDGEFWFRNVTLKEGRYLTNRFNVNTSENPNLIFQIPNETVDVDTLRVRVQNSSTDSQTTVFNRVDTITNITSSAPVYWVQEGLNGKFEIYFGDGVLGKSVVDNNIVIIDYIVASTESANGIRTFVPAEPIDGYTNITLITKAIAEGGTEKETIDSIKFNAPKTYAAQNRIVTAEDFKTMIFSKFPNIESVNIWGGENNDPPVYGKVFISLKPRESLAVTESLKDQIRAYVATVGIVPITVEFVDVDYLFVGIKVTAKLDMNSTFRTVEQIKAMINNLIVDHFDTQMEMFDEDLIYSRLVRKIDDADEGIIGSTVQLRLMKEVTPILNSKFSTSKSFGNRIEYGTMQSTCFNIISNGVTRLVFIKDFPAQMPPNGAGLLHIYDYGTKDLVLLNVGTVNYYTGQFHVNLFNLTEIPENQGKIFFYATPTATDVNTDKNSIITLDKNASLFSINRLQGLQDVTLEIL